MFVLCLSGSLEIRGLKKKTWTVVVPPSFLVVIVVQWDLETLSFSGVACNPIEHCRHSLASHLGTKISEEPMSWSSCESRRTLGVSKAWEKDGREDDRFGRLVLFAVAVALVISILISMGGMSHARQDREEQHRVRRHRAWKGWEGITEQDMVEQSITEQNRTGHGRPEHSTRYHGCPRQWHAPAAIAKQSIS